MTEFINIKVTINDGNFEKFCDKYGIECPEGYDLGKPINIVALVAYEACYAKDLDGLLAKAVKEDIKENYSTRDYEVTVTTREYVTRTYYIPVEAKNEYDAKDKALEWIDDNAGDGYDNEDFDGLDGADVDSVDLA